MSKNPHSSNCFFGLSKDVQFLDSRWWRMQLKIDSLWTAAKADCQLLVSFVPQFWSDLSPGNLKLSGLPLLWNDYHHIYLLWRDPTLSVEPVSGLLSYWLENILNSPCIVLFMTIGYWIHVRAHWAGWLSVFYDLPVTPIFFLPFFSSETFSDEGKAITH